MPKIIYLFGWSIFFYADEGNEPIHVHVEKGEKYGKYWLNEIDQTITEERSFNINNKDKKQIEKIIIKNFEEIVEHWNSWHGEKLND